MSGTAGALLNHCAIPPAARRARPALSQERLGRAGDDLLVYSLKRPTLNGRTEIYLTPLELLDRLARLIAPPRIYKHRYCGVLAPNASLRQAVIEWNRCANPLKR